MRKRILLALALAAVICLAAVPRADAHVGISIGIPLPGIYIGPPAYPAYYYPPAPVYYGPPTYPYYGGYGYGHGGSVVIGGPRFYGPRFSGHRHWGGGGRRWGGGHHWR